MPSAFFDGVGDQVLEAFKDPQQATWLSIVPDSDPVNLDVIFNPRHQEVDHNGIAYGALMPVCWFRIGLIEPDFGDDISIAGITYKVNEINPRGDELVELRLTAP